MSWNGLSDKEATHIVATQSFADLENQCWATSSIIYAINKIGDILQLTNSRKEDFTNAILSKDHTFINLYDETIYKNISDKWKYANFNDEYKTLFILESVHNGWVKDNVKKFNKEGRENKRYQHLPLEIIGWKEAKADLLFVEPILNAIGVELNEEKLEKLYNSKCARYYDLMDIEDVNDLADHILHINKTYVYATKENKAQDEKVALEMANQVIERMPQKAKEMININEA